MPEQTPTPLLRALGRLHWVALGIPLGAILLSIAANYQDRRFATIDWYVEMRGDEWQSEGRQTTDLLLEMQPAQTVHRSLIRNQPQPPGLFSALLLWGQLEITNIGMMRTHDGRYTEDSSFKPFEEATWRELTDGVPIAWVSYFGHARSRPHALAIRQKLLDQRTNLVKLKRVRWKEVASQLFTVGVLAGLLWLGVMLVGPVRRAYRPAMVTAIRGGIAAKGHVESLVREAKHPAGEPSEPDSRTRPGE